MRFDGKNEIWTKEMEKKGAANKGGIKLQFFAKLNSTSVILGEEIMFHGKRVADV